MNVINLMPPEYDPLAARLTTADDRVLLNHWMPPPWGIVPLIRFRTRWYSALWALPILFVLLVAGIAIAKGLRQLSEVQAFIDRYPGIPASAPAVNSGFPLWLRVNHFLNLFFMASIVRAGVQILADHPRLYWHRGGRSCDSRTDCRERFGGGFDDRRPNPGPRRPRSRRGYDATDHARRLSC